MPANSIMDVSLLHNRHKVIQKGNIEYTGFINQSFRSNIEKIVYEKSSKAV